MRLTAAIFAWREGGMGVEARGLRLLKRPATLRAGVEGGAGVRGCGRGRGPSWEGGGSDMAETVALGEDKREEGGYKRRSRVQASGMPAPMMSAAASRAAMPCPRSALRSVAACSGV